MTIISSRIDGTFSGSARRTKNDLSGLIHRPEAHNGGAVLSPRSMVRGMRICSRQCSAVLMSLRKVICECRWQLFICACLHTCLSTCSYASTHMPIPKLASQTCLGGLQSICRGLYASKLSCRGLHASRRVREQAPVAR